MTPHVSLPRLFGDAFAADPEPAYRALRTAGPVAWAEIAPGVYALVVTDHRAAVDLLTDPDTYSKDSRRWAALTAGQVPPDSPVLALMAHRPNLLYADGPEHRRLRGALEDCLARIDTHRLREITRVHAGNLIEHLAPAGHAELMAQFADVLPLLVFADLLGCPPSLAARMVDACHGIINADLGAQRAAADFAACLGELVHLKKTSPGPDLSSWLLDHPHGLNDTEVVDQLFCTVGAGTIPTAAWIASGLELLLRDHTYAGNLTAGSVTVRRALEQVLWTRSPMANFSVHFARHDTHLHRVPVPADVPVLISHAATGTDPALPTGLGHDNRSHLAWSAGPHRCPATSQAGAIAQAALETLLDRLWDLRPTGAPAPNRPGPFHQCPAALHVAFRPRQAD
ncbi:cytochrome P450, partial [Streptomyces alkaliphilus]|uniref:cytochrome P450 n=1 Tax=Streptomyces alkaliphilus TaxID=1472722 RepID=UPI00117D94CA